ncbi:AI-2E family transporter [Rhodopseudomonas sp. RCAM05734]|uniref:AI-2E family transporter n=1 Tax=Rhodopseudomonas sp. RCAM05734 TaxID=3457549 RepID=UPI0040450C7B
MRDHLEDKAFLILIVVVSVAFALILTSFYGAILWGVVIALMFAPLHRQLLRKMPQRSNLAALVMILLIVMIVILPLTLIAASLTQQAATVVGRMQSGELNFGKLLQQMLDALPGWATGLLDRFGVASLGDMQEKLTAGLVKGGQTIAAQALDIGQSTFAFMVSLVIMLYLLFFLFRDGDALALRVKDAIPLRAGLRDELLEKFTVVIRATVKGSLLVALAQGALGGLIFWILGINAALLWAVLMAFLSLLPAVGAGLVWMPVALYLLATGSYIQGAILIAYGFFVIGLVDNIMRPMLVGKDTKLPDYVVLISTLGGIEVFGLNGFVIGPVIAAMFIAAWDIFSTQRKQDSVAG